MSTNNDELTLQNLFDVTGRVAVVTGGGTGIGLMCTQALAVNGAKVYILGRRMEALQNAADTHGKNIKGQIIPLQCDITDKNSITQVVKEIESKEKCVCVLINNAGISGETQPPEGQSGADLKKNLFDNESATFDNWVDVYRTNVASIYFMSTAFLPLVEASTKHNPGYSGTILNITSISGLTNRSQNHFAYNASKGAAIHLTKMLASEISSNDVKVRVNNIAPGVYPSEMTAKDSDENQKSHLDQTKYQQKLLSHRSGNDKDMANAVLFCVTNQYLNGQTIPVDGGYLLSTGT